MKAKLLIFGLCTVLIILLSGCGTSETCFHFNSVVESIEREGFVYLKDTNIACMTSEEIDRIKDENKYCVYKELCQINHYEKKCEYLEEWHNEDIEGDCRNPQ